MAKKKPTSKKSAEQKSKPDEKTQSQLSKASVPFPVVGIGASAGGLEALDELFDYMPFDSGISFVIFTHQHPGHKSLLAELLGKHTKMPVVEAIDGIKLEPNCVYVGPPNVNLALLNGSLHVMNTKEDKNARVPLPIDYFFRSLAADQQDRAICIVLSGTGTDGTIGLKAIKEVSGMAMVQQPQSAKYAGMPSSALATGLVDYSLPVNELPAQLVAYCKGPYLKGGAPAKVPALPAEPLQKIFLLLRSRSGHDFSSYKSSTICRRIERRMNVHQITDSAQYVRYLQEHPHELDQLFKELLISVTNFFRDNAAFEALAKGPVAELLKSGVEGETIRGWVPGCATGEEVYSLAILLREGMEQQKKHFDVQIFGTDLDSDAIEKSRVGVYPQGLSADVSPGRLKQFFLAEDSQYRIRKEVREMAVFAPQNVIKDPPFTKLDFLSCRNLLIYLNADLQKRLMRIFHYAIKPGGFLFLGPSESIGEFDDLFETVDKKWKIFRCKDTSPAAYPLPAMPAAIEDTARVNADSPGYHLPQAKTRESRISTLIEREMLNQFCPASVVVNDRGDMIHVHGRTGDYLEMAEGHVRTNVLDMARKGLTHELGSALRKLAAGTKEVNRSKVRLKTNVGYSLIDLQVRRIENPESIRGLNMITFRPSPQQAESESKDGADTSVLEPGRLETMELELKHARETNQAGLEELETSNEELKSTNEELQSTNEELQSTNEELETSKEEMHSLNEELTTVNCELQSKVEDLSQTNDDMQNLLNSTDVATIFLDRELNINRCTDQAKKLIMIRESDLGRPISELVSNVDYSGLWDDCRSVLKTLNNVEVEVRSSDGRWHMMKIMPYRTSQNLIDGLVLTFVDISQLMAGRKALAFAESVSNTVREPLVILDNDLRVVSTNKAFCNAFKTSEKQSAGELIYDLGSAQWDIEMLRKLLTDVLKKNDSFEDYRVSARFPKLGERSFLLNARRLDREVGLPGMILLAMEEVSNDEQG